jgi:uncharacterized protein
MSIKTAMDAMKYISDECGEGCEVQLFGGEPLLRMDLVEHIMTEYPTLNYSIFTNATLLTKDIVDFFSKRGDFIYVVLSLDGILSQEKNRKKNIDEEIVRYALKKIPKIGIKTVVTEPDKCIENVRYLANLGAKRIDLNIPMFSKIDESYMVEFKSELRKISEDGYLSSIVHFDNLLCKSGIDCSAGYSKIAISPDGDIYPCAAMHSMGLAKMGSIYSGVSYDPVERLKEQAAGIEIHDDCLANKYWYKTNVYNK